MKIVCDNCATKYSIADEKVSGKVFKIRCKKCGHTVVVRGTEGASAQPVAGGGQNGASFGAREGAEETAVASGPGGAEAVWHLVIDREQVGPMTAAEVRAKFAAGQVDAETYAWREGFGDWLRLASIEDFRDLNRADAAAAAAAGGVVAAATADESGQTRRTDAADVFASHQAAASGDDDGGASDLFGAPPASPAPSRAPASDPLFGGGSSSGSGGGSSSGDAPMPMAARGGGGGGGAAGREEAHDSHGGNGASAARLTGQRNENSVLFSLNNLQALATGNKGGGGGVNGGSTSSGSSSSGSGPDPAAPRPGYASAKTEGSGLIDIRAMAAQTLSAAPAPSLDSAGNDLPSLGSAPVFSPVVAAPILMPQAQQGMPKWVWGVIAGAVLAVGAIVALLVVMLTRKPEQPQYAIATPPAVTTGGATTGAATPPASTGTPGTAARGAEATAGAPGAAATDKPGEPSAAGSAKEPARTDEPKDTHKAASKHDKVDARTVAHHGGEPAGGTAKKEEAHPSTAAPAPVAAAPAAAPDKPAAKPKKNDELAALLDTAAPDAPAGRKARKSEGGDEAAGGGEDPNLPDSIGRDDVLSGMRAVTPRAKACYAQFHVPGTVIIKTGIAGSGRIQGAEAIGVMAGTPTGDCVVKAVKSASFKKSKHGVPSVNFPFILP